MMKNAFRCVQIVLLLFGVFGADEDEVKSVMEGDSVTLHTNLTQIKKFNLIEWRFGDPVIAQISDGKNILYPSDSEIFRDRLQLDQTGSLTIKNMKTKHSGLYELQISHGAGTTDRIFNVTVYASVSDAGKSEMKSVSLKEGDRVTLQTDVTLSGDELIVWRFGDEGEVIAKADIEEAKSSPLYYDERFGGRLELDQTGSLIITDTRYTDSGFYAVKISSKKQTLYKRFTVTVSVTVSEPGLSSGDKAGIVIGVLLFAAAAAVAAAVGVIYYRRQISELQKQILTVTEREGEPVTLKPNKEINKDDEIQWMFGEGKQRTPIAKLRGETGQIVTHDDAAGGRFRDRLELDKTTRSLTIRNSTTAHSGLYTLNITSSGGDSEQRFMVTVNENVEEKPVEGGGSVTLNPDTEIQGDDLILWTFGYRYDLIARIRGGTVEIYAAADEIFRGRLKLNKKTGSLTITDIKPEHTGRYKLQIISSRGILCKKFWVFMSLTRVPMTVGESVHLSTELPEIPWDDVIEWRFGEENSLIAEIKGWNGETYDGPDERFRDRLQLDTHAGDLTIKNSTDEHAGDYKLKIRSSEGDTNWTYSVIRETLEEISVEGGGSVTLKPDTEIQRDDQIIWTFGDQDRQDRLIAEIRGGAVEIYDDNAAGGWRFRGRLELNKTTGSLTITHIPFELTGLYKLQIITSSRGIFFKKFRVFIPLTRVPMTVGESVHLSTDIIKILWNDVMQWRFGEENSLIAEIKGLNRETYYGPDERFRDRLQLDTHTGDLTIKNSTAEHAGDYKLKIRSSEGDTNRTYSVTRDDVREKSPMKRKNEFLGKRVNESVSVEMRSLLNKEVPDGVNESVSVEMQPLINK